MRPRARCSGVTASSTKMVAPSILTWGEGIGVGVAVAVGAGVAVGVGVAVAVGTGVAVGVGVAVAVGAGVAVGVGAAVAVGAGVVVGVGVTVGVGVAARQPAMITKNRSAKDVPKRKLFACLLYRQRGLRCYRLLWISETKILKGTRRRLTAPWRSNNEPLLHQVRFVNVHNGVRLLAYRGCDCLQSDRLAIERLSQRFKYRCGLARPVPASPPQHVRGPPWPLLHRPLRRPLPGRSPAPAAATCSPRAASPWSGRRFLPALVPVRAP